MKTTLLIFTLNEIDGMRAVMPRIRREWYDQLVIVDGGSTDGTVEYARENGYFIFRQKGPSQSDAFREAMERVEGDIVIAFSPDGNSVPERIPDLVQKMKEGYDIVTVSRYLDGAWSYDDDLVTAFGNRMFTGLINVLFGGRITDALVMFKAYRTRAIRDLGADTKTVSWATQLLLRAMKKKYRIAEIPGDEPPRIGGVRKMDPLRNGVSELAIIARERWMQ